MRGGDKGPRGQRGKLRAPVSRLAAATNPARLGAPLPRDQALGRPDPHVALCTRGTGLASQATEPSAAALAAA